MASCKQCFHYEACKYMYEAAFDQQWFPFGTCDRFSDSSRIIELPCKIGDPVFVIGGKYRAGRFEQWINPEKFRLSDLEKMGKTVFLTRAEAEAALAKMKGGANNA